MCFAADAVCIPPKNHEGVLLVGVRFLVRRLSSVGLSVHGKVSWASAALLRGKSVLDGGVTGDLWRLRACFSFSIVAFV